MEEIGSEVRRLLLKEAEVEEIATKFTLLEVRFRPHSNKVEAEVGLYDADGNPVGGSLWVSLASGTQEYEALLHKKFEDINLLVKGRVQAL